MGRTIDKGASVGEPRVTNLPRERRSPVPGESEAAKYGIEITGPQWGRVRIGLATIDGPLGQLHHFICLWRQTERPTPPPGVMASNDCAVQHEAA